VDHVRPEVAVKSFSLQISNSGRKSRLRADYNRRGKEWTAAIVIERLQAAFAPKHRSLDNACQKQHSAWSLVVSHEDYSPGVETMGFGGPDPLKVFVPGYNAIDKPKRLTKSNFESNFWRPHDTPPDSDYWQLCCKGATMGNGANFEFVRDRKKWRNAFNDGSQLLMANGFKVEGGSQWEAEPDPEAEEEDEERNAREAKREIARQVAVERKIVRANPDGFQELCSLDLWDRGEYIVNDELLAIEAQEWVVRPMTAELETDRIITLAWLKSGLPVEVFCRRRDHDVMTFLDRVRSYTAAQAERLNKEHVPVKPLVRRLDYGKGILQGVKEIAGFLGFSIGNVQKKLDAGLIPVASFPDGTIIASESMIRHLRDHHKRPLKTMSQVSVT
jgi:hypothetical protein